MAYMSRLGIWGVGTPFNSFMDFLTAMERRYCMCMYMYVCTIVLAQHYMYIRFLAT